MNIDQIAMCYISMDLHQRVLHTNGKLFSNFKLVFEILAKNIKFLPKIKKYSKELQGMNIDQIATCYISMDSSQRALQTNEKLFLNFGLTH